MSSQRCAWREAAPLPSPSNVSPCCSSHLLRRSPVRSTSSFDHLVRESVVFCTAARVRTSLWFLVDAAVPRYLFFDDADAAGFEITLLDT